MSKPGDSMPGGPNPGLDPAELAVTPPPEVTMAIEELPGDSEPTLPAARHPIPGVDIVRHPEPLAARSGEINVGGSNPLSDPHWAVPTEPMADVPTAPLPLDRPSTGSAVVPPGGPVAVTPAPAPAAFSTSAVTPPPLRPSAPMAVAPPPLPPTAVAPARERPPVVVPVQMVAEAAISTPSRRLHDGESGTLPDEDLDMEDRPPVAQERPSAPQAARLTPPPPLPSAAQAAPPAPPSASAPPPPDATGVAPPPVPVLPPGVAWPEALSERPRKKRLKPWFEEVFDEDYLRTLPFMTAEQTLREVAFIKDALSPPADGQVLDVGCGYGRHAIELGQRGLRVTGIDLSLPLLIRAADESQRRALSVNFVHADMREMAFENQFDGAYCVLTSFGYFDEETNLKVATAIFRSLKPGGRFLVDTINRDYIAADLPTRVWWEGDGCVVLEEVDFNFHTSRLAVRRSVVFQDGRQLEQDISIRAYSLHEMGKLLRQAGFRVLEVSGSLATKGRFFGATSRSIIMVCERPTP